MALYLRFFLLSLSLILTVLTTPQKLQVPPPPLGALGPEDFQGGHGVDGRVHVPEGPFVGGDLTAGVKVARLQQSLQLLLGELHVEEREDHAVICEIPGREPGVLPAVRHGEDMGRIKVTPAAVAALPALRGRRHRVAVEPAGHLVVEELLAPDHAGHGLPEDQGILLVGPGEQVGKKEVGFLAPGIQDLFVTGEGIFS